jgi:flavin reductase (DIM6/NTAB) family NADH-FMN oxidoreductase RutF
MPDATVGQMESEMVRAADELREAGRMPFVISIGGSTPIGALGYVEAMRELAGQLGRTWAKHPAKLDDIAWKPGPATGSPVLDIALGRVECRVQNSMPAGDHTLYLAEVVEAGLNREGVPLTLKETGLKYFG